MDGETILRGLESDTALVPAEMRDWWREYLSNHRCRYLDILSYLKCEDPSQERVLEIGSVPGHCTVLLKGLGYAVEGVDLSPGRLSAFWAKHGVSVAQADIEQERLPFEDGQFSVVLFMEIIEHLRVNPLHALREALRVLRVGGRLLLSTPNITPGDRLRFFLFQEDYQGDPVAEYEKLEQLGHMGHCRIYSRRELRRLLEHVGLRVEAVDYHGPVRARRGWPDRLLYRIHPHKERFRREIYIVGSKAKAGPDISRVFVF